jgi:hypothetical protein
VASPNAVGVTSVATRCLVALASSAACGVLVPVFVGVMSVVVVKVFGVPDTMLGWGSILAASSLGAGYIAAVVARSQLRVGWADAGRRMRGPFGLASLVFGAFALVARGRLLQPGVFEESSPYLATTVIVMTAFTESALGALVLSVVLGTQSRE